jgi:putative oxidoreductase
MKKAIALEIICGLLFLLFVYTGLSKLMSYPTFVWDLGRDPLIGKNVANVAGILLPLVEISVAGLLMWPLSRNWGLYSSAGMMTLFTIYVRWVIHSPTRHCTCGGVIREMTWQQHFWFNVGFTLLCFVGISLHRNLHKKDPNTSPKQFDIIGS